MKTYTICTALNKRRDEIMDALDFEDFVTARKIVSECLEDPNIGDKEGIAKAKLAFGNKNNNHFCSVLVTYLTCIKVC